MLHCNKSQAAGRKSLFMLQYNSLYMLWMKVGDRENCVQGG